MISIAGCCFLCVAKVSGGMVAYGSPLFPGFPVVGVCVPLYFVMILNKGQWFPLFSKVFNRRLPFVGLGFPVAWYASSFAFRWF